jgi:diguanylate cyclase (GGDEF)-like protein
MTTESEPNDGRVRRGVIGWLHSWQLWRLQRTGLAYFVAVDGFAIALTAIGLTGMHATESQWWIALALLLIGIGQAESTRQVERLRRRVNVVHHVNLTSVWTFAGLLLLPPGLALTLPWLLYLHLGIRSWHGVRTSSQFAQVLNAAAVVISAQLTQWVFAALSDRPFGELTTWSPDMVLATAVAALAFSAFDLVLIALAASLRRGWQVFRRFVSDTANVALDVSTNCLGAFVALSMVYQPLFVALIIVPVLVLHRSVLVKELEDKAIRDQKTGLLNVTAWNEYGTRELARAERAGATFGVLMVDLDHFKSINDTYGHPVGDDMLIAVAGILKTETRRYDSAGRFGGEEFVVLLPMAKFDEVTVVAERIRRRVNELEIDAELDGEPVRIRDRSASIGIAMYPSDGETLEGLVRVADNALYSAKRTGRNRVVRLGA